MKISAMSWVGLTTLFLVLLTIAATMGYAFHWIFWATVLGQAMVVYMVCRVLTDQYHTDKTFEDFYEDYPIGKQEELLR